MSSRKVKSASASASASKPDIIPEKCIEDIYKKKYKEFADKFEALCDEFAPEDFDVKEVKQICGEIIDNYGE